MAVPPLYHLYVKTAELLVLNITWLPVQTVVGPVALIIGSGDRFTITDEEVVVQPPLVTLT